MNRKHLELATQLRHELHRHPELSNHESWTKQHLIDFLKEHTTLEIVDRGLWFYAVYRAGENKDSIAFRADFDAVPIADEIDAPYQSQFPGVGHKCGHDGHSASLACFALEINETGADKNIYFLFQHAEETGDGAEQAAVFIKENNISAIYAFHNMSGMEFKSVNLRVGTTNCASRGMTIHMEGVPTHASQPEFGVNPAFAIAKLVDAIPELTSPENNKGMVLCTVIQIDVGERAFGVSASNGDLLLTIRAVYEDELDRLQQNLEEIARHQAELYGLKCSFSYCDCFPMTSNDQQSVDEILKVCEQQGIKSIIMEEPFRGSEDFGHYLKQTRGAICFIGNGEDYPQVHTVEFDFRDEIIETAVTVFKGLAELA
ncbi:M20 metallopeptidase family protein [Bacilliculturomica massiliensis]|uniref:M20 metallopeptidase family protein n=1 Tax=Bacilliculturomica massiliensis TaxID=1917867 RepID=UPI00103260BC|nr:amidohydrolase [Bacilliculturomica massiliensis]